MSRGSFGSSGFYAVTPHTAENQRRTGVDLPLSPLASFGLQLHMFGQAQLPDDQQVKQPRSKTPPMDLLIVACSPNGHELGQVRAEAHEICKFYPSSATYETAASPTRLGELLGGVPTKMFLFCGHADAQLSGQRTLCFTSASGGPAIIAPETLQDVFKGIAARRVLELVFLNGCSSRHLGEAVIAAGVPHVVCWDSAVPDQSAKLFSLGFFGAVQEQLHQTGKPDYVAAFNQAKAKVCSITRPGSNGFDVPTWEFRAPVLAPKFPGSVDMKDISVSTAGYMPTPYAAGIPVLLPEPGPSTAVQDPVCAAAAPSTDALS